MLDLLIGTLWITWPLTVLIPCLGLGYWKRRALAAEKIVGKRDLVNYTLAAELDRRNKAAQAAAQRSVMEALDAGLGSKH